MQDEIIYATKKSYKPMSERYSIAPLILLTVANTINQSSKPKAFTILTRTKHLSEQANTAVITKAISTANNCGPRFGMAMAMFVGGNDACTGRDA